MGLFVRHRRHRNIQAYRNRRYSKSDIAQDRDAIRYNTMTDDMSLYELSSLPPQERSCTFMISDFHRSAATQIQLVG